MPDPHPSQFDNTINWLLDPEDPGVRYLALRDLTGLAQDDAELAQARRKAHEHGPIDTVLRGMHPEGFWAKPGAGYGPKYRSTVWAVILLGQLGASLNEDGRVSAGCTYLLDHTLAPGGQFSTSPNASPSGTIDCLQGNLLSALLDMGCEDPRLEKAVEWTARSVTGEGVAPLEEKNAPVRYYQYKRGPDFRCGANFGYPCAWGAVKVLSALSRLPAGMRTPLVERAIARGVDFFFSVELTSADWPGHRYVNPERAPLKSYTDNLPGTAAYRPSGNWWKFGFPLFYVTDLLQVADVLARLGYGCDPRMAALLDYIRGKADPQGRWALEYEYNQKTWGNYGVKRQPNKWVTLRALRALKAAGVFS